MPALFDPMEQLPLALQDRLDSWRDSPPRRQFQAYGPLTAYLQAHKFSTSRFLVKPQKLLRLEAHDDPLDESQDEGDEVYDEDDDDLAPDDIELSFESIDSHGVAVSNKHPFLPDFTIDRYWGADIDANPRADIIRVVVEVASLVRLEKIEADYKDPETKATARTDFRNGVILQLRRYLDRVGSRCEGKILGVALLGNEVALREVRDGVTHMIPGIGEDWINFFDGRFVQQLNVIRDI